MILSVFVFEQEVNAAKSAAANKNLDFILSTIKNNTEWSNPGAGQPVRHPDAIQGTNIIIILLNNYNIGCTSVEFEQARLYARLALYFG